MTERVTLDGKPYVILPEAEFEELRRLAEDAEDEAAGIRAAARRSADVANGEHLAMPRDQWLRIRQGENPLTVVREFRGLTKADLANKSGVNRPEISDIEAGKRRGSLDAWKAFAKALNAPLDVLTTGYAAATGFTFVAENDGYRAIVPNLDINVFGETRHAAIKAADALAVERWNASQVRPELETITAEELNIHQLQPEAFTVQLGEL